MPPKALPTGAQASDPRAVTPPHGPGDPLELLIAHLRGLAQVEAAAFLAVDEGRTRIEPAARWFGSSSMRAAMEPTLSRPYDHDQPGLVELAMERGRSLFIPRVEDWGAAPQLRAHIESQTGGDGDAGLWEAVNRGSVVACPVRTPMGNCLGVLVVASSDERHPLSRDDLRLIEVLADLAALALERSDLLSAEAARAHTETLLKQAAEGTSGTLESGQVYAQAVDHAVAITRADCGGLSRLMPGATSRLTTVAWLPSRPAVAGNPAVPGADPAVLGEVARSREARLEPRAMHAPVALGPRLFGVLSVARTKGAPFDAAALDLLGKVARISAAGIANAVDFERERRIVRSLTRGFLPETLPRVERFELGLLSEPADSQPTGGDLYGAWRLSTGQVALLIGDVAGKGLETAALGAMARFFIEARSWDCDSPAEVLAQANTMLASRLPPDTFVTAFLALLSTDGVTCATAGHLAPLLRRGSGEFGTVGGGGLPLGVEGAASYEDHQIEFGPGDVMLAFTDGLVEARRAGELYGGARLARALAAASARAPDLDQIVREVVDDVRGWAGSLTDDAVALAVRRRAS